MHRIPVTLSIAGNDSSGGAGSAADVKTMSALGCYAAPVLTAFTVQNTLGVAASTALDAAIVRAQIDAVAGDFDIAATKIGMLANASIVHVVADAVAQHSLTPLVLDPVLVSTSGHVLLADDAIDALVSRLLPRATLLTPNAAEAARLSGLPVTSHDQARRAIAALVDLGARAVLLKGGHLPRVRGEDGDWYCVDLLWDGDAFSEVRGLFIDTPHTHGTGCTYASAIAAGLARGHGLIGAVRIARRYLNGAIANSLAIGQGRGPVDHFWYLEPGVEPWSRVSAGADD
jgi:hydroxymethylpyrimidine/phosphomethylpyrimidine kinase